MTRTVSFVGFWPGSQAAISRFFLPLISKALDQEVLQVPSSSFHEIQVCSVFTHKQSLLEKVGRGFHKFLDSTFFDRATVPIKQKLPIRIWYTGEAQIPPFFSEDIDFFLSYEKSTLVQNNFYLPLWVLNFDWFGLGRSHGFLSSSDSYEILLSYRRKPEVSELTNRKFACAFINNPENMRMTALKELRKIGEVDVYGGLESNFIKDKMEVANKYRFVLCFENQYKKGYVSEKLLEAYQIYSIPLYWGWDSEEYFNPHAYLNLADYNSLATFIREISEFDSNLNAVSDMISQPLLMKSFPLDELILALRARFLDGGLL